MYTFPRGSTQTFLRFLSIKCCKRGREKNARRPSFFFSIPCTRQPCHPAGLLCCLFEDVCRLASLSMSCVCTGSFCMGNFHVAVFLWCVSLVLRQDYRGSVGSLISPGGAVVSWIICSFGRRFCPSPSTCGVSEIWPWMKIRSAGREKLSQHLFFCGELWVENFIANCISVWLRPFLHSCTHREILHGWENHRGPLVLSFSDTRNCAKFAVNQSINRSTYSVNQSINHSKRKLRWRIFFLIRNCAEFERANRLCLFWRLESSVFYEVERWNWLQENSFFTLPTVQLNVYTHSFCLGGKIIRCLFVVVSKYRVHNFFVAIWTTGMGLCMTNSGNESEFPYGITRIILLWDLESPRPDLGRSLAYLAMFSSVFSDDSSG